MTYTRKELRSKKISLYIHLTLGAFIVAFAIRFFINLAGVFTPGIAGIAQGATYTLWNLFNEDGLVLGMDYSEFVNNFYVIFNWLLNIPVIIFCFLKLDKKFGFYSVYVMAMSMLFSLLLTNFPGFNSIFTGTIINDIRTDNSSIGVAVEYIAVIFLALIGGIIDGVGCGLVYKKGYSTMGFDPVAKYLELYKSVNITFTIFLFSLLNSIFWIFVNAMTSGSITSPSSFLMNTVFSPSMFATIIFICAFAVASNLTYPSLRKVAVEVISNNYEDISNALIECELVTGHTLRKSVSGFKKEDFSTISIIAEETELKDLIKLLKHYDKDCIIYTYILNKVYQSKVKLKES